MDDTVRVLIVDDSAFVRKVLTEIRRKVLGFKWSAQLETDSMPWKKRPSSIRILSRWISSCPNWTVSVSCGSR